MKKFFLIVFFSGSCCVAALIPFLTKVVVPDMMNPAPPVYGLPLGLRDYPIPEQSVVAVSLELPISALAEKADHYIPRQLKGEKPKNFHPKITDGVVNWKMWPGKTSIQNTGNSLSFTLPIRGEAHSTGDYGMGLFQIKVKANSSMAGSVKGNLVPTISPDWQVMIPKVEPVVSVHRAQIKMAGFEIGDARSKIRKCLEETVRRESGKIAPCLTQALQLKKGVKKLWDQAHINRLLPAESATWAVFDPGQVEAGPIDYSDPSKFSVTLGIAAESLVTNAEPIHSQPEALPDLVLKPDHPVTDIRVPVVVNFRTLNHSFADRIFSIKTGWGPEVGISAMTVESGIPGYLNLNMNLAVPCGETGKDLSTRIQVRAKPMVDCLNQTLGFTDVSLSASTGEPLLSGVMAWLMDEIFAETVSRELRIDLKEYLPKIEQEIQKIITSFPVPDTFELRFEKPEVKLIEAYTVQQNSWNEAHSPGIVFVMGATGTIAVTIKRL